jgi:predicted phage terminase large subunit-like protein
MEEHRRTAEFDGTEVQIALPQDPGQAGKHQAQSLTRMLAGFRVLASPETGTKAVRATPVAAQAGVGNLRLVQAPWNACFLDELSVFPDGEKDDQVDALSRAFMALTEMGSAARFMKVNLTGR